MRSKQKPGLPRSLIDEGFSGAVMARMVVSKHYPCPDENLPGP